MNGEWIIEFLKDYSIKNVGQTKKRSKKNIRKKSVKHIRCQWRNKMFLPGVTIAL